MRVSVVIPAFNEQDNVIELHHELVNALGRGAFSDYELIFVDDASTDGTAERVRALSDPRVRLIRMPERSGQSLAQREGFLAARYEAIATIDADRQEDPADLNPMAALLEQGWDFVQGSRPARNDRSSRRFGSRFGGVFRRLILGDRYVDMDCTLRLFRRQCVEAIRLFNGAHRFLPYLAERKGFRVTEIDVRHRARVAGHSKYGTVSRAMKGLVDLFRVRFTA